MKIYSSRQFSTDNEALSFIEAMNKFMGKDAWVYFENKRWGSGYYIQFVDTYIQDDQTHVISHALYIDDINDPDAAPLSSSRDDFEDEQAINRWLKNSEYDLLLTDMFKCYKLHMPLEILSTDDVIELCTSSLE